MKLRNSLRQTVFLRVEVDDRSEKLGYKLREAQRKKYLICLLSVIRILKITLYLFVQEKRATKGAMAIDEFIKAVKEEIDTKRI